MKPIGPATGDVMLDLASALGAKVDAAAPGSQPSFQAVLAIALQETPSAPAGQPVPAEQPTVASALDAAEAATEGAPADRGVPGAAASSAPDSSAPSSGAASGFRVEVCLPARRAVPVAPVSPAVAGLGLAGTQGTIPVLTGVARSPVHPAAVDQAPSPGASVRRVAMPTAFAAASLSIRQSGRFPEAEAPVVKRPVEPTAGADAERELDAAVGAGQTPAPTLLSLAVMAASLANGNGVPASAGSEESNARQQGSEHRSPSDSTASALAVRTAFVSGLRTAAGGKVAASPADQPDAGTTDGAEAPRDARLASIEGSLEVELELGSGRREALRGPTEDRADPIRLDANAAAGGAKGAVAAEATRGVGSQREWPATRAPSGRTEAAKVAANPPAVVDGVVGTEPRPIRSPLEGSPAPASAAKPSTDDAVRTARRPGAGERDAAVSHAGGESPAVAPSGLGMDGASLRTSGSHETEGGATTRAASHTAVPREPQPQATDRVTVHLPDEAGGGRIQIAVRGDVVHARILGGDQAMATRLESGLGELRGALAQQGFQETHVRVDAPPAIDKGWATAAAAESAAGGDTKQDTDTPERRERDRAQHDPHSDPRQQRDGRSQQRARRERER